MKKIKRFEKAFGRNDFDKIDFPMKMSGIRIARIEIGEDSGCSRCFPHGFETVNPTTSLRSWKNKRKQQWKK